MDATENQWVDVRILNKTLYYYLWTMFVSGCVALTLYDWHIVSLFSEKSDIRPLELIQNRGKIDAVI